jgi:adenylate kinase
MATAQLRYLILLGAPGVGKGTQADLLEKRLGLPHVASGDLFRENLNNRTPLGLKAQGFMERGELVPDDVTIAMVMERLARPDCVNGVVLDGFPRTVAQAEALDQTLAAGNRHIEAVINLTVTRETLMARLTGRWICRDCQASYHVVNNPPRVAGRCDNCGGELYQRIDDEPETVARRLEVYFAQTAPLIDYYRERGLLREVQGEQDIEAVQRAILDVLGRAEG